MKTEKNQMDLRNRQRMVGEISHAVAPIFHLNKELITATETSGIRKQVDPTKAQSRFFNGGFDHICSRVKKILKCN